MNEFHIVVQKQFLMKKLHIFQYHNFRWLCFSLLNTNAQSRKAPVSFITPVRPSANISATPAGRISVKFDIRNFYEHLSRKYKFG